jgi:hypothetical protein
MSTCETNYKKYASVSTQFWGHRKQVFVKTEIEIGFMLPHAKEHQGFLATIRSQDAGIEPIPPESPEGTNSAKPLILDFWLQNYERE